MRSSRADLSCREATTSSLGELGGLGTGGDVIHPRRARTNLRLYGARSRLLGVALTAPLRIRRHHHDWDLERVLSAIRASVSETPASPRMETRAPTFGKAKASTVGVAVRHHALWTTIDSLRPSPRTLYIALPYRQASGSTAPRPFINDTLRTRQWTIRAPDDRRTRPPVLSPRHVVSFSPVPPSGSQALDLPWLTVSIAPSPPSVSPPYNLHHAPISPHVAYPPTRLGSSDPSPPIRRPFSRSTFSEPPRIRLRRPQATICCRSVPNARKTQSLRTTSWSCPQRPPRPAHIHHRVLVHAPRQAITIMRPKPSPRAGPTPFLRASGSSVIASFTPPLITHKPRTSQRLPNGDFIPLRAILAQSSSGAASTSTIFPSSTASSFLAWLFHEARQTTLYSLHSHANFSLNELTLVLVHIMDHDHFFALRAMPTLTSLYLHICIYITDELLSFLTYGPDTNTVLPTLEYIMLADSEREFSEPVMLRMVESRWGEIRTNFFGRAVPASTSKLQRSVPQRIKKLVGEGLKFEYENFKRCRRKLLGLE
ncbi:hypothetical protein K438DRAFT_2010119 [Mycena galopus ATCC 62051]|nr:hypothetical protein K438DRAFT_2010119 [Mycena galopus ATCC 62051]